MKQQPLFKQTLLDLINVKPCNADAFRQGQTWANEKRRYNMTVRKTIGLERGHAVAKAVGKAVKGRS